MSSAQIRLFVISNAHEISTAYNMPLLIEIKGKLEINKLNDAVNKLIQSYELLRTSFALEKNEFLQIIEDHIEMQVEHDIGKENIYEVYNEFIKPFQLSKAPLMRVKLVSVNESKSFLLLDFHHIIADGESCNILWNNLSKLYLGESIEIEDIQYKDYSAWRETFSLKEQEDYWLNEFSGEIPILDLKTDFIRQSQQSFHGDLFIQSIDRKTQIRELCKKLHTTEYIVMMSAFSILLSLYTRQQKIVLGIPVSGRTNPKIQNMVGMFVNTLAIQTVIDKEKSFIEIIEGVAEKCFSAYENQDYPFDTLIERLNLQRNLSRNPLFDVMFAQENSSSELEFALLEAKVLDVDVTTAKFDLSVTMIECSDGYQVGWEYCTDLYRLETVKSMALHYAHILDNMLQDPEIKIKDIMMVDEDEKNRILFTFNKTDVDYPSDKTIIQLFEEQVEKVPDKVAVELGSQKLTYRELNGRANHIGRRLRREGVKVDDIVGILTERSLEMIIGMYGILKAGAAYMPMDPKHPFERISYILNEAKPQIILIGEGSREAAEKIRNIKKIDLQEETAFDETNLPHLASPKSLAYIIFTSGSTGNPKGVMVQNGGVVNVSLWQILNGEMNQQTEVIQNYNYIFDASVSEIFPTGLAGAKLKLLPEERKTDPELFLELLPKSQLCIVPSMFRIILEYAKTHNCLEAFKSFDKIYLAAEELPRELLDRYCYLTGNDLKGIYNIYGPTETTDSAVSFDFSGCKDVTVVPIGKPISNVKLYILDGKNLCGIGMPGELCIGGAGVSRGYLNRPELTAEKFIENPYLSGERIYRTGDLCRWMEDGNVEYLGRIDSQVKLKGFRIELGEIESRLREITAVKDALVIVREKKADKYLCAYVIGETRLDAALLKEELSVHLPDYMVPTAFVQMEEFPRTGTSKLDRRALPEPEISEPGRSYCAPRTRKEQDLTAVFQEILNAPQVGIDDDFFELGGDSIKAIRIVSKIRERGYTLNIKDIMQGKTVRSIAFSLRKKEGVNCEQGEVSGEAELTPVQKEFFERMGMAGSHFNQSLMLESEQAIDSNALQTALFHLTAHHDILRAVYKKEQQRIRKIGEGESFRCHLYDYTAKSEEGLAAQIEKEAEQIQKSMNLTQGPLFQAALFHTKEKDYLLLCSHHLVVDGVSWRILLEDLETGYRQVCQKEAVVLPEKGSSFQEWGSALLRYRESSSIKQEESYWKEAEKKVFCGRIAEDGDPSEEPGIERIELELAEDRTQQLLLQAGKAYQTEIDDLLLTAISRAVSKLTGQQMVSIQMEGHGREAIGEPIAIDRTVGWFTSIYPITLEGGKKELRESIIQTKETLQKVPNKGIGYGVITYLGKKDRQNQAVQRAEADLTYNYLGEFTFGTGTGRWTESSQSKGAESGEDAAFRTGISMDSYVSNKKLKFEITYDRVKYRRYFMEQLSQLLKQEMAAIIAHCVEKKVPERTASDYNELSWSQQEYERISQEEEEKGYHIQRIMPLTGMQEGMLYHKILNPKSSEYVIQSIYQINQSINEEHLRRAFVLLNEKHEMLRSKVVYRQVREPRQLVLQGRSMEYRYEGQKSEREFEELCQKDLQRGFDLEEDSLQRAVLVKLGSEEYRLLVSMHHIIMDGWCSGIVMGDLGELYQSLEEGKKEEALKESFPRGTSYEDYVRRVKGKDQAEGLAYWKELLAGYEGQSEIRAEGKGEAGEEEIGVLEGSLSQEVSEKLEQISIEYGVTLNTIVETAWGILLQKYNGTKDAVFGKVVSGRNEELRGIEELVGLFINTIPVRVETREGETVRELLEKVQEQALQSEKYDYCSLAEIQKQNEQGSGLLQTVLAFENYYSKEQKSLFELIDYREQTNYDITLAVYKKQNLKIELLFTKERYNDIQMKSLLSYYINILNSIANAPLQTALEIEVLDQDEKSVLLDHYNRTFKNIPLVNVIDLFQEQVDKHPKSIAVITPDHKITYQELDSRSNQVANRLMKEGLKKGEFVGLMAEKKMEVIICLLGILKAGGAYMPIDTEYPYNRIEFMINDSNCKILLFGDADCHTFEGVNHVNINEISGDVKKCHISITGDDLAYLIYTSGTTGQPKGVMVEHKNIIRLVKKANYTEFENIKVLQTGSLAFDASTFEIWGALLNGGSVYIADKDILTDIMRLKDTIINNKINTMFITTALFNQLISIDDKIFHNLDQLYFGGEATSEEHVEIFINNNLKTKFYNVYGPTETTTFALYYKIEGDEEHVKIPIGQPISNTTAYVLSENKLCGYGMVGELYIGGLGVSRGYLNREKLTAEKFIQNPYNKEERIYKTGDIVRRLSDGNIEYIGRSDNQVKIHGYRIELDEITNRIKKIDGIQDAITIIAELDAGKTICAYIVTNTDLEERHIKEVLLKETPEYMVPKNIIKLNKMPLTSNGKIDIKSLPAPEDKVRVEYISPRNDLEYIVTEAFKNIFNVSKVGIDDGFLELGGHSIIATRLINFLYQEKNVRLSLKTVLTYNTPRKIAKKLSESKQENIYTPLPLNIEEAL
jgi:amino acid adenylation domain-containing protein/non-ribosomal peptide synthase protein (TIGR01720 family)